MISTYASGGGINWDLLGTIMKNHWELGKNLWEKYTNFFQLPPNFYCKYNYLS